MATKEEVLEASLAAFIADVRRQCPNGYITTGAPVLREPEDLSLPDEIANMHGTTLDCQFDLLSAVRAALRAADALGWKLVPKEATEKMALEGYRAAQDADDPWAPGNFAVTIAPAWTAMIAAAPSLLDD